MTNGSAKGSSFERKICKELSLWWTRDSLYPRDDVFWRSSGSGARATVRHRKGKSTANAEGDIIFSDPLGQPLMDLLCIELKCGYGEWSVLDHLETKQKKSQFWKFWEQATESALNKKAHAALIYKKDRKNPMFVVSSSFIHKLEEYTDFKSIEYATICSKFIKLHIMKLEDFFECVDPSSIIVIHQRGKNEAVQKIEIQTNEK